MGSNPGTLFFYISKLISLSQRKIVTQMVCPQALDPGILKTLMSMGLVFSQQLKFVLFHCFIRNTVVNTVTL
jgi:hypothetical protein